MPPSPLAQVPDSVLRDALATSWCAEPFPEFPMARTATTTGRVNGTPGRTASGGAISKVSPYSRLELPVDPVVA